jgi:Ca2+-transporting ATPase
LEWLAIVTVGAVITAMMTIGYIRSFQAGQVEHGRAMALAVLTLSSAAITAVLSGLRTTASRTVVVSTVMLSALLIQARPLSALLSLTPLHRDDWALAGGAVAIVAAVLAGVTRFGRGRPTESPGTDQESE